MPQPPASAQICPSWCRPPAVEPFVGPAILSGRAAAVFFHEIFGHRIEGHRQKDESEGQTFTKAVGTPVLPSFLSVVFDPTRRTLGGMDLNGYYTYDDEGVKARPVTVVDNGVLKTFLMSRSPIQGVDHSNGHGRRQPGLEVVSRQSNLIVESTKQVSEQALREMLIAEIKRQNKPYGLFFDEVTGGYTTTQRRGLQAFTVIPLMVYRVLRRWASRRAGARRGYRRHAAGEFLEDSGDVGQAGSVSTAIAAPSRDKCRCRPVRRRSWFPRSRSRRSSTRRIGRRSWAGLSTWESRSELRS